jgi:hypothetical protein
MNIHVCATFNPRGPLAKIAGALTGREGAEGKVRQAVARSACRAGKGMEGMTVGALAIRALCILVFLDRRARIQIPFRKCSRTPSAKLGLI